MESKPKFFNRKEIISLIALIALIISIIAINIFKLDNNTEIIKNELQKQGYDVEGIEFVRDERSEDWFYQSSEPILYEGNHISYWLLKRHYVESRYPIPSHYSVEPFLMQER